MPVNIPSLFYLFRISRRSAAVGSALLAGCGVAASLVMMWPAAMGTPADGVEAGRQIASFRLLQLLPVLAALVGLLASLVCLAVAPAATPTPLPRTGASEPFLATPAAFLAVVQELREVLDDERSKVAALQEVCNASTRETRIISASVARLAEAALDAETRLGAVVAKSDQSASEMPQAARPLPPEIDDLISRFITEQARATAATIDAAMGRMSAAVDPSVQTFLAAVSDASRHMTALGETAIALHRDVIAFNVAGREIATAGATVVSRLGGAVDNVDAAVALLPGAAATLSAAADRGARALTEASAAVSADVAARAMFANETREAAEILQREAATLGATKQEIADAAHEAIATVAKAAGSSAADLAAVRAVADEARQGSTNLVELTTVLQTVAATLLNGASSLDAAGQRIAAAGETVAGATKQEIADAAHQAIATVAKTAETAAAHLAAMLAVADDTRQGSTKLVELTTGLQQVAATLMDGAAKLDAAGERVAAAGQGVAGATRQEIADAARAAVAAVGETAQTAAAHLAALTAVAGDARQRSTDLEELTAALQKVATTLIDGATGLDAAGQRVAAAGEWVAGQLATDTALTDAALSALPDVAAELTAAAAVMRHETTVLAAAAKQMSAAGTEATSAVTNVAVRAEMSVELLDTASRMMSAVSAEVGSHIDRLAGVVRDAETHVAILPDVAEQVAAAAARLQAVAETWPPEWIATVLPETAERMAAAALGLDRLDSLSCRLENAVAALPDAPTSEAAFMTLTGLSGDIAEAVCRVEGALAEHERVWPTLAASVAQVEAAALAASETPEWISTVLPETAERVATAAQGLDRLDALSQRLERAVAALPDAPTSEAAMTTLSGLSGDISEAVRRVEGALAQHERVWPTLAASVAQVETAAVAVAEAAADRSSKPVDDAGAGSVSPADSTIAFAALAADSPPAALTATLRRLDEVSCQTETLLRHTEVLAEAVVSGRADILPPLLADRTPALLGGIETITRRLRSVATALALVSDGIPTANRRFA